MKRGASAYRRDGRWALSAQSQTVDGFWIGTAPFVNAGLDPSDQVLGRVLWCLIELSIEGVATPSCDADIFRPVLRMAEVKSHATFMRGSDAVSVFEEWGRVTLTPLRNLGAGKGSIT